MSAASADAVARSVGRNVVVGPTDDVRDWPAEAVLAAVERGGLTAWRRLVAEVRRDPCGPVAGVLDEVVSWGEHPGLDEVFALVLERAHLAGPCD